MYSRTTTDNYMGLLKRKTGPLRLIMGPWTHGARSTTYSGDVDFGPGSTLDALGRIISFIGLGAALLVISFLYARHREILRRVL